MQKKDGGEDDTSVSPGLKITMENKRELTGKVFVDKATGGLQLQTGQERIGDGEYNKNKQEEPGVKDVEITFKEEKSGETYTAQTDNEGDFSIKDYIPGDYQLTYTWGENKYQLNGKEKTITVQDYKGTIYKEPKREDDVEWYKLDLKENSRRYSDAKDNWETNQTGEKGSREQIDAEIQTVNQKTETTKKKMDSTTPPMKIRLECQEKKQEEEEKQEEKKQEGEIEYEEGEAEDYREQYKYIIRNVDFGIIERPKQDLAIIKRVKSLKLALTNGQTMVDLSIDKDGNVSGNRKSVTYIPPSPASKNNGFVKVEIDNELLQGSVLEVTYEIKVKNISEIDYEDKNYYTYGIAGVNPITIKPTKIIDYLDNEWAFDENGSDWKIKKHEQIKDYLNNKVFSDRKSTAKDKKLLWTEKLAGENLKIDQLSTPINLKVSKILTTTNEISLDNETEIIELNRRYGRIIESVPGNYIPGKDKFVEPDDSMAETVSVTPATGANYNFVLPISIGIISCSILVAGIIIIKKKVI